MDEQQTYLELSTIENLASFLSRENLLDLLNRYIQDSETLINKLKIVLTENNAQETTRLVHSLKSTSANIGAIKFSELAKSLEHLARTEKLDEVHLRLAELTELFEKTRSAITQLDFMKA
jgi:HPt (histidine-containing phosphotransfer) domain-containing protein